MISEQVMRPITSSISDLGVLTAVLVLFYLVSDSQTSVQHLLPLPGMRV
jgi:hypothetical protein